jgi:hypothetical protein
MGLIEAILAIFFAIFCAALSIQVVDEFKAWNPWLIDVLVGQAIRRLPEDQRERYAEQWRGDIEEIPGQIGKLLFAVLLPAAAWKMSRILPNAHPTTFADEVTLGPPEFSGWPSAVILADNSPAGTVVASGSIVNSDGSAFTGTITITDATGNLAPVTFQP